MSDEQHATGSSGNVFEDLGLDQAEDLHVKAQLAAKISSIIKHRHLTQKEAADVLGTTQPKVSSLMRGELYGFSVERMYRFLNALGRDVDVYVNKRGRASDPGRTVVHA